MPVYEERRSRANVWSNRAGRVRAGMAARWSAATKSGVRNFIKWANVVSTSQSQENGELLWRLRYKARPFEGSGMKSGMVAGLLLGSTTVALWSEQLHEPTSQKPPPENASAPEHGGDCLTRHAIADAAARAAPAVVNVKMSFGRRYAYFGETAGSGFIIQSDGTILTNAHVVANEQKGKYKGMLAVTLQDGRKFEGEVISFDALSDLAVIKVESSRPLPTAKLGSSKDLRPGEWVVALGSPLHLHNTVTAGIISCVDRKNSEIGLGGVGTGYIQTDAAINQGNSGGPLVNLDGEVIGINTMKALAADGVSFAIPIDAAIKIVEQLKKRRRVVRPWLGMKMWELTEPRIVQLKEIKPGFPDVTSGVLVSQVIPGSPAARAGVWNDDVIVEFDGVPINNINQIVEALGDKVGTTFVMRVKRSHGEQATLNVVAEEASPDL